MNITDKMEQLYQPYTFEQTLDISPFLEQYWSSSFLITGVYLLLIVVGQNFMKSRKSFDLQVPLTLWSFFLAVFSIVGTLRTWGYMGMLILMDGPKHTLCFTIFCKNTVISFWSSLFLLSKVIELGDTVFIILRKRPLIFVHWYHHSTVLLYTSFAFKIKMPSGGLFMAMNFGVHAIMYTYYTLKAAKVECPRKFSMLVTSLQILQMVLGTIFSILAYIWRQDFGCHTTEKDLLWSMTLYVTYFILFAKFFLETYILPKVKDKTKIQ
ncbi:elongation of very long chain fatty acids protein 3 [Erinaceus europaeus]|uniref:Elongation of very long chain fatty acids protein n=1 Tax=Erinaceus europaeus TaxID=9365 RepID=A0A1S3A8P2_ERIEU|nr:elongation of very long chain fatty acids protein 3 [Erinaceus europaeus]